MLDRGPDPLARLNARIGWMIFRQDLKRAVEQEARGLSGRFRHDHDMVMMSTVRVLQRYYNFSDEQSAYPINDRLSVQKFLELTWSAVHIF